MTKEWEPRLLYRSAGRMYISHFHACVGASCGVFVTARDSVLPVSSETGALIRLLRAQRGIFIEKGETR